MTKTEGFQPTFYWATQYTSHQCKGTYTRATRTRLFITLPMFLCIKQHQSLN